MARRCMHISNEWCETLLHMDSVFLLVGRTLPFQEALI